MNSCAKILGRGRQWPHRLDWYGDGENTKFSKNIRFLQRKPPFIAKLALYKVITYRVFLMKSKQQIGREYRVKALRFLARVGYATTRQIAMAIFGTCDVSTRKMTGRTIRSLLALGYLVKKRNGDTVTGEMMLALNRAGVAALSELIELPDGRAHARDWIRHAHKHRTACNSVFAVITRGLDEDVGWSELEIRAGVAPAELSTFNYRDEEGNNLQKIPDLLLHGVSAPIWVEVENAWRGTRDFHKLVLFLRRIFGQPIPLVEKVWFVVSAPGAKTIGKRLCAALTHRPDSGYPRQIRELDAHILAKRITVLQLDAEQLKLTALPLIRDSGTT